MAGLGLDDLDPILLGLGDSKINLLVESSRPQDRRIQQIWTISCSDDEDLVGRCCVHLLQQLCHNAIHYLVRVSTVSSLWN